MKSEINQGSTFVVIFPAFLGKVDQLISKNRANVLNKAIIALRTAPAHELAPVSHEMGGAVGFYDLEKEQEVLSAIQKERAELINSMLDAKNKGMKTQLPKKKENGHYHCDTLGEYCKESHYKYN